MKVKKNCEEMLVNVCNIEIELDTICRKKTWSLIMKIKKNMIDVILTIKYEINDKMLSCASSFPFSCYNSDVSLELQNSYNNEKRNKRM